MLYSGFVLLKFLEEGYFVWLTVVGFLEDIKKNPSKKLPPAGKLNKQPPEFPEIQANSLLLSKENCVTITHDAIPNERQKSLC